MADNDQGGPPEVRPSPLEELLQVSRRSFFLATLLLSAWLLVGPAAAPAGAQERQETVNVPVLLDYVFLRSALVTQVFDQPGEKALVLDQDQGCTLIELWDPKLAPGGQHLNVVCSIRVRVGMQVMGKCVKPVEWNGFIRLEQAVLVDKANWRLLVRTAHSRLYNADGSTPQLANAVWSLVQTHVHARLDRFTVDLVPSRQDLNAQLPLLFKPGWRPRVERWLKSLRLGDPQVYEDAVRLPMGMEVLLPADASGPEDTERAATPEEMDHLLAYWETWDAFLVQQMLSLAGEELTPAERDTLLTVLLSTRHAFVRSLAEPYRPGHDLVREQFLASWRVLAPLLRRHLARNPSPSLFNYLAFFTASDALAALDKLGPTLGLDISRPGLLRLAQLLQSGQDSPILEYRPDLDRRLRGLLGLGPAPAAGGLALSEERLPLSEEYLTPAEPSEAPAPQSWLLRFLVAPAWAAPSSSPSGPLAEVMAWLPIRNNPGAHLRKVWELLEGTGKAAYPAVGPGGKREDFLIMTKAVAWQESCFRQFVREDDAVTPLRSSNNTSVGMMQINERVWRGVYETKSLRWDIRYNARAGNEILKLYLERYVAPRQSAKTTFGPELTARLVYALYNGGPAQLDAFLKRYNSGKLWQSDRLFWQKYLWTRSGEVNNVASCLLHPGDRP